MPQLLSHQGRLAVNGVNFDGSGQFKFALVNSDGSTTYWSNDGTGSAGLQPTAAVTLTVSKGLYAVLLGDTGLSNMTAVPTSVFDHADVRLRVWFNDGSHGFQLMTPDQRLAASPYAMVADKAARSTSFDGSLAGEVTGTQGATAIAATTVTNKTLTGFVSGAGAIAETDTIISAINKLDGNDKLMAPLASPNFTGTVGGITAAMVGLGNVSNTSDANKPVSTAQQTALDLKAPLASPTFTGVVSGSFSGPLAGNAATATSATNFSGSLVGDVTGTQSATAISATTVTGKALTGYVSGAGTIAASDSILSAINKLNGNDGLKAPTASPAFTGIPSAPTALAATNTTQLATTEFVQSAIQNVVGVAPAALDTLGELATALNNDQSYASTITNALSLKAPIANPTFTGTVAGITPTMVGLGNVTNTSDANKPVSTAQQTALDSKAPLASPVFTGTVKFPAGTTSTAPLKLATGINLSSAVFGSVEFDGTNLYLTNNSGSPTRKTIAFTDSALATGTVGSSQLASGLTLGGTTTGTFSGPLAGNVTGNVTGSAASFTGSLAGDVTGTQSATVISAATVTGKLITGYVSGSGVVSAADTILSAINKLNGNDGLKANLASPTFTGTVSGITATMVGLGNVNDTSDASKPVSTLQQTALDLKAPLASPTFTGSVSGITKAMVGLGNVTNTNDVNKPVSTFQQAALDLKANLASPTFTGTVSGITATMVGLGNVNDTSDASKPVSTLQQTALDLKAPLASPTFTGSVSGITKAMVGLSNVTNTNDVNKPVSTFQQAALDLKANLASPTFTGTVSGITATMVGLGNVTNTSDANKPVSTAQQTALNLKANLASPTFSGTVALPTGTSSVAPLKFAAGTSLTTAAFGSMEFDGTNLYLTNNAASPIRKTLAFTDSVIASVPLTSLTAAPLKPVVAWGNNHDGQTTLPTLANVAAVAAGDSHSLVLLDDGTVVAWGLNTSGQTTVPSGLTGVTEIAASASQNLVRKSDGTLVAWGDNSYGQNTIPSGITTATKVAAGEKHNLALLANGTVRAWGDNGFGQTTLPSSLTGATITAIAAGYDHCLALKSDGTVISWGRDDAGQVTQPSGLSNVVAIAAGAYHSLALKSDGTVIAWGWDGGGQATVPVSLSGVSKIAGGYAFSMALKSDGTLVLWGDNTDGETTVPSTATQVTHIAAGATHALALRSDSISAQVARLDQDNVFTGKVGIKRTAATNSLEVEGSASKTTAGSWLANSDRRIKTEIQTITGALEKIDQVRLVDFRYTVEYRAAHPCIEDVRYPNVIAQEFAAVFPDDVKSSGELMADGSPILQVDTYPLTIYSAAAVQELHLENQELKKKIADQELKISDQERRLRRLEEALENK